MRRPNDILKDEKKILNCQINFKIFDYQRLLLGEETLSSCTHFFLRTCW